MKAHGYHWIKVSELRKMLIELPGDSLLTTNSEKASASGLMVFYADAEGTGVTVKIADISLEHEKMATTEHLKV